MCGGGGSGVSVPPDVDDAVSGFRMAGGWWWPDAVGAASSTSGVGSVSPLSRFVFDRYSVYARVRLCVVYRGVGWRLVVGPVCVLLDSS